MNVLVIGSGGREHAIIWKLRQSKHLRKIYCAPGSPGIGEIAENVSIKVDDLSALTAFAKEKNIDLTVVGPEYPLSLGIVDEFEKNGLRIFGPNKKAAQLEASKSFAKEIMIAAGVPTAKCEVFTDFQSAKKYVAENGAPIVLKADGLAAGKGVFVCQSIEEAYRGLDELFGSLKADKVVVEEFLSGKEVSYIVATDGKRVVPFASSHDYKRIKDGDQGPNTGGMGTVCPTPNLQSAKEDGIISSIILPVVEAMAKNGTPFQGFLYAGLMIADDGKINVLEFNARLGDPETQVILRRMETDLLEVLDALTTKSTRELPALSWSKQSAVCVVIACDGYPVSVSKGDEIFGLELAHNMSDVVVFQAGTALSEKGKLVTNGGRVLNVTAVGSSVEDARKRAYCAADVIQFRGRQMRRDIGASN